MTCSRCGLTSSPALLRSPGYNSIDAASVSNVGDVLIGNVTNGHVGVRPALWVKD